MTRREEETTTYISHLSAAIFWEIPFLHVVFGYSSNEAFLMDQSKKHRSYAHQSLRRRRKHETEHSKSLPLPIGAIYQTDNERVSSPELVYLELAGQLNFHQRVLLGMQLCSSLPGKSQPLTTKAKLGKFLSASTIHQGASIAQRSLQYVADNSWSIMESLLYMQLTLPNMYGGYGLKGAILNAEIALKEQGKWQKTNQLFADLYWKKAKLVVEYDSYEHHSTANAWARDAQRVTTLQRNRYSVLSVNTAQFYDDASMAEVAQVITRYLGKKTRITAKDFSTQKAQLRELLPRRDLYNVSE